MNNKLILTRLAQFNSLHFQSAEGKAMRCAAQVGAWSVVVGIIFTITGCNTLLKYSAQYQGEVSNPVPVMQVRAEKLSKRFPATPMIAIPSATAAVAEIVPLAQ